MLPIGMRERRKAGAGAKPEVKSASRQSQNDLERRIAELEAGLGSDSSSGSDSDPDADASGGEAVPEVLSSVSADLRIPKLPASYLPASHCGKRTLNTVKDGDFGPEDSGKKKRSRKTVQFGVGDRPQKKSKKDGSGGAGGADKGPSGLEQTVRDMLADYKPTSSERRPFWCRICSFQGSDQDALLAHRETEMHVLAARREKGLSFCKLCRKQFTSIDQLKGHVKGKQHIERLERMKAGSEARKKFC